MKNNTRRYLILLIVVGLVVPLILQAFSHIIQTNIVVSRVSYYLSKLLFIVLPPLYWLLTRKSPIENGGSMKRATIVYGMVLSVIVFLSLYASLDIVKGHSQKLFTTLSNLGMTNNFLLYSGLIIIFNSLLEELYWRYAVYGGLKEMLPKNTALAVSSFGFALMHLVYFVGLFESLPIIIILTLSSFVLGMFWGTLYEKTKNILYVWINHALVNAPLFYIEYLLLFRQ